MFTTGRVKLVSTRPALTAKTSFGMFQVWGTRLHRQRSSSSSLQRWGFRRAPRI